MRCYNSALKCSKPTNTYNYYEMIYVNVRCSQRNLYLESKRQNIERTRTEIVNQLIQGAN